MDWGSWKNKTNKEQRVMWRTYQIFNCANGYNDCHLDAEKIEQKLSFEDIQLQEESLSNKIVSLLTSFLRFSFPLLGRNLPKVRIIFLGSFCYNVLFNIVLPFTQFFLLIYLPEIDLHKVNKLFWVFSWGPNNDEGKHFLFYTWRLKEELSQKCPNTVL